MPGEWVLGGLVLDCTTSCLFFCPSCLSFLSSFLFLYLFFFLNPGVCVCVCMCDDLYPVSPYLLAVTLTCQKPFTVNFSSLKCFLASYFVEESFLRAFVQAFPKLKKWTKHFKPFLSDHSASPTLYNQPYLILHSCHSTILFTFSLWS